MVRDEDEIYVSLFLIVEIFFCPRLYLFLYFYRKIFSPLELKRVGDLKFRPKLASLTSVGSSAMILCIIFLQSIESYISPGEK